MTAAEIEDPELARYLNRSYWEQKQQEKESREKDTEPSIYPSAPVTAAAPLSPSNNGMKTVEVCPFFFLSFIFQLMNCFFCNRNTKMARRMK